MLILSHRGSSVAVLLSSLCPTRRFLWRLYVPQRIHCLCQTACNRVFALRHRSKSYRMKFGRHNHGHQTKNNDFDKSTSQMFVVSNPLETCSCYQYMYIPTKWWLVAGYHRVKMGCKGSAPPKNLPVIDLVATFALKTTTCLQTFTLSRVVGKGKQETPSE